ISRLLASMGVRAKHAVTTLDADRVIIRPITLPSMNKKELRKAILFETEASLPEATGEIPNIFDYKITRVYESPEDNTEKVEVLIMAAEREPVIALAEAVQQADLQPLAVDLSPVAAWRAERRSPFIREHGEDFILITVNDRCTDLSIVHNGALRLIRSLPIGTLQFLEQLGEQPMFDEEASAASFEPEPEPEPEILPEPEMEPDEAPNPFEAFDPFATTSSFADTQMEQFVAQVERQGLPRVEQLITDLVDETLNTIRYGQSFGKEGAEISFAVVDGYYPYGQQFCDFMADKLGMPVLAGDPFADLDHEGGDLDEQLVGRYAPMFSTAVGLAIRGLGVSDE
ncbi:MAG TPA: pilus assembly protein PilM, partial [bacterium]|nr:pilus assembly protein PilM [bacterium]